MPPPALPVADPMPEITCTLVQYFSTLVHVLYSTVQWVHYYSNFFIWRSIISILSAMHSKLLRVHTVLYISKLHCLWNVNFYILYISTLSQYNCTESNFLWPIVVISWLKAQKPKFNAYILNLKGPKKSVRGPNLGPGPTVWTALD